MSTPVRVGVIGAGAAGTCVLDTVTNAGLPVAPHVTVFEDSGVFGPGRAYRPRSGTVVVNLPSAKMSVRPGEPGHFTEWLARTGGPRPEFVSREIYGRYLAETFDAAAARLGAERVPARVVSLRREGGRFALATAGNEDFLFDVVFLCVGSAEPADVHGLAGLPRHVQDPYPLTVLDPIPPADPVAVLGTGLSAVDVVLELCERGHEGPLWMVSRSGYLPGVRDTLTAPSPPGIDAAAIKELARARGHLSLVDLHRLVSRGLSAQGVDVSLLWREFRLGEDPADRLRRQLAGVDAGDPVLPRFLAIAGVLLEQAWRLFDDATRRRFLARWHGLVGVLCAPMPVPTARRLTELVDDGRLRIAGGLTGIRPGFLLETGAGTIPVRHVVNTVRPAPVRIPRRAREVVDSLVSTGLAVPHPFGGIRLDGDTAVVTSAAGAGVPGLYAIGELATGELYLETTVLPALVRRVAQAVQHLLSQETR